MSLHDTRRCSCAATGGWPVVTPRVDATRAGPFGDTARSHCVGTGPPGRPDSDSGMSVPRELANGHHVRVDHAVLRRRHGQRNGRVEPVTRATEKPQPQLAKMKSGTAAPGRASIPERTLRTDNWRKAPIITFILLSGWVLYA